MKKSSKKSKNKMPFILFLALIVAIGTFIISLMAVQRDIYERKQEIAALEEELSSEKADALHLQKMLEENKDAYLEERARELGYIIPGEKVFYDVNQ